MLFFAIIDADILSTHKEKHPSAHPDTCFPSVPELSEAFAHITEKEVAMGIKSFPSGSAGGPDGLCPQHLKDLTSESAERGGRELLSSLTSFINHILEGNAPHSVCPILFGATFIALRKKEGGIRPIAIGLTLRCLAAKIGGFRMVQSVGSALVPLQLGCGVRSGCEAAARAARQYLESMPSNHVQSKSELICDDMFSRNVMLDDAPSLRYVSCSQGTLLGSPIGGLECIDHTIEEKVDMLERMGSRLHALSSHDALLLLRHSFAILKVLYVLRTAPCFLSPELARFDESLRHLVCAILNVPLDDNSAWLQASLPVRSGGIGFEDQYSWHLLPIWPFPLVVQS